VLFSYGNITFGIGALDPRVSLLRIGHFGVFNIMLFCKASEDENITMWI